MIAQLKKLYELYARTWDEMILSVSVDQVSVGETHVQTCRPGPRWRLLREITRHLRFARDHRSLEEEISIESGVVVRRDHSVSLRDAESPVCDQASNCTGQYLRSKASEGWGLNKYHRLLSLAPLSFLSPLKAILIFKPSIDFSPVKGLAGLNVLAGSSPSCADNVWRAEVAMSLDS